jgi:hypothetical protein
LVHVAAVMVPLRFTKPMAVSDPGLEVKATVN